MNFSVGSNFVIKIKFNPKSQYNINEKKLTVLHKKYYGDKKSGILFPDLMEIIGIEHFIKSCFIMVIV